MSKNPQICHKVLIVGESNVGKTSILNKFTLNIFEHSVTNTIGIDFAKKDVTVNNKKVSLQIWDTAGQERFRSITKSYYRGANAILLVFSLDDIKSYHLVDEWMRNISEEIDSTKVPIILVASKIDMIKNNDLKEYEEKAKSMNVKFFATSANTGYNIEKLFSYVAEKVLENEVKDEKKTKRFKLSKPQFLKKRGWC